MADKIGEIVEPFMEEAISQFEKEFQAGKAKILTPEESNARTGQALQETRELVKLAKSIITPSSP